MPGRLLRRQAPQIRRRLRMPEPPVFIFAAHQPSPPVRSVSGTRPCLRTSPALGFDQSITLKPNGNHPEQKTGKLRSKFAKIWAAPAVKVWHVEYRPIQNKEEIGCS